jgi:RNA polymerase-binding protein DksA
MLHRKQAVPKCRAPSMLDGAAEELQAPPGGQPMGQYARIQADLLAKQAELVRRLARLKENLTAGRSADSQEQAQELENAEVVDALGNEARAEISKIAKALDQIKNNTYGICADCGDQIPMARLEAYPFADRCIRCATVVESTRRPR